MKAKEFLKSKGINYEHEVTGMSVYVQNAGSVINAVEKLLDEYAKLRLSNVSNRRELLLAYSKWWDKKYSPQRKDFHRHKDIDAFLSQ